MTLETNINPDDQTTSRITPHERARLYSAAFPHYPACWADRGWVLGQWNLGNNYRGSGYHGAYPPQFLKRVLSMFPEPRGTVVHLFSGSIPPGPYIRVDINPALEPDVVGDATALPFDDASVDLILADPPYSNSDAERYGVPMVDRKKALDECTRVLRPGGNLVWLDMVHPMYRKRDLRLWGEIGITRSTNHRYRIATFYERQPAETGILMDSDVASTIEHTCATDRPLRLVKG